ncbi:phage portal protein [Microbacterium sp. F51-2R]|uniref:phage portal protein n=1 Tax=Microbacterium sp. F51-2R TaxID=3445777 RepID=UPI003F9F6513
MSDKIIVPGLSEDETVTVNVLADELRARSRRNLLRSSYYDGKRAIRQIGSIIPPQYYRLGIALGWAAKGVDGLDRRVSLEEFVWNDGDLDSIGMSELEESNFLLSELASGRTDAYIHGVSYLITTQGAEGEPRALVHAKDARNAFGQWNSRKRALDNLLSVTAWDGGKISGFVLYLDGETISAEKVDGKWAVTGRSEHPWHVPADPQVYRPRSGRRMGRSRITRPLMSHQDSALRELIRLEGHMDVFAMPKMFLLGASDSVFKNPDGSMKAAWQMVLGRVMGIPDDEDAAKPRADVKQFDAQSPEPHIADLNMLAKLAARETDLPDSDFALSDIANPTSADSYVQSRENLISEAEGAQRDLDIPSRRTVTRALAIQNGLTEVPPAWRSIKPKWRSPLYVSKAAQADAGAKQIAAGPEWLKETTVALELLGLTPQQIEQALKERRQNAGREVVRAALNRPAPQDNADGV